MKTIQSNNKEVWTIIMKCEQEFNDKHNWWTSNYIHNSQD